MIVDLEVHNSAGTKVAQQYYSGVNFSANQTLPYTWSYPVPAGTPVGTYTLWVGVFTSGWGALDYSDASAASFNIVTAPVAQLLSYLTGLDTGSSTRVLSGQHSSYWDSNPMDVVTAVTSQTGDTPAILGTTLGIVGSSENGVTLSNSWLSTGGIVEVSLWPDNPLTGVDDNDRSFTFSDIYTSGTSLNTAWNSYLNTIATNLKAISGTVLFRNFVECNGNWSWWGGQPTAQFIALWQYTRTYLINQGVNNVLWVYNVNGGSGNETAYYPGASNVDVISIDAYSSTFGTDSGIQSSYSALKGLGKPLIFAECGASSAPNQPALYSVDSSTIITGIQSSYPQMVGYVVWCQNWAISNQNGAAALLNNPWSINFNTLNPQYSFESSTQGWTASSPVTSVATSTTHVYSGSKSLAVNFSGTGTGTARVTTPSTPDGAVVTFHIWIPSGSQLTWIQPYVNDANFVWTGAYTAIGSITTNAWNTITVTVPSNAALPLASLGVQFNAGATWSGTCYVDAVSW
jgi:hypothetical protein